MAEAVRGKAVTVREPGKFQVEDLTFAAPGPGQVRVKIHACGLCHSDVSFMSGKIPHPMPMVLGHEGAGTLEALGPGLSSGPGAWKVGDRVVLTLVSPCGRCHMCKAGRPALCTGRGATFPMGSITSPEGTNFFPCTALGCMAEYAVVSANAIVKVGDDTPLEKGALVSCGVTTGVGAAMNRAKVHPGSICCVVGCGGVGLNTIQGCRICGAGQIIAVDTLPSKLQAARRFGATHTVNAKEVGSVIKEVQKLTGGGADYSFEVIGFPETAKQAYDAARPGGTTVLVGVPKPTDTIPISPTDMIIKEKILTGSFMGSNVPSIEVPLLLSLYKKGDLLLDELVSRYYPITEARAAFDDLDSGSNLRGVFVMHDLLHLVGGSSSKL